MARFRLPDALPPLTGWVARLYAAFWCVLLVLAIAGPIGAAIITIERPVEPLIALGIDWHGADVTKAGIVFGSEARARHVRPDDLLLTLDGRAIDRSSGILALPPVREGRASTLTLQTPGAMPRTIRLMHRSANIDAYYAGTGLTPTSRMVCSAIPFLLIAAFQILVALVLFQRRREPVAALLSVGILGLVVTNGTAIALWEAIGWTKAISIVLAPARMAFPLGLLLFPSGRLDPRWVRFVVPVIPLAVVASLGNLPGAIDAALALIVVAAIVTALIWRFLRDRRSDGARQWRWAIIGFVGGFVLFVLFLAVLQPLLNDLASRSRLAAVWEFPVIGTIYAMKFMCLFGGLALSVLRYRLYATQAAVSRSVLYGALTVAVIAIFAGSEKIIEVLGEEYFGESLGALAGGLGAAFAAVAVGPLHHRIAHWVEHRFRKNLIHLRRDLPPLLDELGETGDPETVAHVVLDRLAHGLHAARGAVLFGGRELAHRHVAPAAMAGVAAGMTPGPVGELTVSKDDPLFPFRLRLAADGSAALLVGPRPDDSRYDRQERDLIADLATPLARALRVSADRMARDAANAARFDALERALASLRDDLHGRPAR